MASSTANHDDKPPQTGKALNFPFMEYFTRMAESNYGRLTGDTTRDLFKEIWDDLPAITAESSIHDNAGGPGTVASVIVEKCCSSSSNTTTSPQPPPTILITDYVPVMVQAATTNFAAYAPRITARVADSHDLAAADIAPGSFTHSICNFSVCTAVISTWKHFGVGDVMRAAQRSIRPDQPPIREPGPEFLQDGYLADLVWEVWKDQQGGVGDGAAAAAAAAKTEEEEEDDDDDEGDGGNGIRVLEKRLLVHGEQLDNIKRFISSDLTARVRAGWSADELRRWPVAVEQALEQCVAELGGIGLEAWFVLATKNWSLSLSSSPQRQPIRGR